MRSLVGMIRSRIPDSILANMSLEEKIGQMMIMGFHGTTPSSDIKMLIQKYHIGGTILFSRNITDPRQVVRLTKRLQSIALASKLHLPLLMATDQEGGLVSRITKGVAVHPGNMALGATRSRSLAHIAGDVTGKELRAMGINMNLAPVLDVNNNPKNPVIGVRSFGEDPFLVSELGVAMIRGLQKNKVIATAKHFPGHGDTSQDSHEILPVLPHSLERLRQIELRPFRAAISCGVIALMISHLSIPAIDKTRGIPASLSRRVVTKLLRQQLGHQGLATTDCMEMKAITSNFEAGEAAIEAVNAGVDLVMTSHTLKKQLQSIRAVHEAVRAGEIDQRAIDKSVMRILRAKAFVKQSKDATSRRMKVVGNRKHLLAVAKMAKKSITLTRNRGILPLGLRREKRLLLISFVPSSMKSEPDLLGVLKENMSSQVYIRGFDCDPQPSKKQIRKVLSAISWAEAAIAATYDVSHNNAQEETLREISAHIPLVLVSLREPYDIVCVPEASAHVAAYSPAKCSIEAAIGIVMGRSRPTGKLPVSIHPTYSIGHGLDHF